MSKRGTPPSAIEVGLGLRAKHVNYVIENRPDVGWFELLADNWLVDGGLLRAQLLKVAECYPVALHGVNLSLGGAGPIDFTYLGKVQELMVSSGAAWYSEHIAVTGLDGVEFHDLLPLPMTEESIKHVGDRISAVQDFLGQQIVVENVSSYIQLSESYLSEGEFLAELSEYADCLLLIDANNLYVNEINHGSSALAEIKKIPPKRAAEIHLAGSPTGGGGIAIDTHTERINDTVWRLYQAMLSAWGPRPTLIEWDNDIPSWDTLYSEYSKAKHYLDKSNSNSGD